MSPRIRQPLHRVPRSFDPAADYTPRLKHFVKSLAYPMLLPLYTRLMRALHGLGDRQTAGPAEVWFGNRGSEYDQLVYEADRMWGLTGKRVLLQGVGDGRELVFWKHYRPADVIGVDFALPASPPPDGLGFPTRFIASDLSRLPLEADSVDGVASVNVYEHLRDLDAVLSDTVRVLKPGGWFLCSFGPLYHAPGGDHISLLRGGLENAYAHLLLPPEDYRRFLGEMLVPGTDTSPGRPHFVELDLFSRLRLEDYRRAFSARFDLVRFRGHIDPLGLEFRRAYPDAWQALLARGYSESDLLVTTVVAMGTRR